MRVCTAGRAELSISLFTSPCVTSLVLSSVLAHASGLRLLLLFLSVDAQADGADVRLYVDGLGEMCLHT